MGAWRLATKHALIRKLSSVDLVKSIVQGLMIFVASFGTYMYVLVHNPENPDLARTIGLAIIILANILLVQLNSSHIDFAVTSIKRLSKDKIIWTVMILSILFLVISIYTPINTFLKHTPLSLEQLIYGCFVFIRSVGHMV